MAKNPHRHENPELHLSVIQRARSRAAGVHGDRRMKRLRDRGALRRAAIKEQLTR
ncbi:hypothetical protein [Brachybacterium kimchii]|uniref:Uncharacterized protein n=1 Tax=Brachybacterium kimchii TaxID=2942909 RepID=A0ABY4N7I7_9MICO|nr:hypothetical protein [Brachybacterium kimchii]UQN30512.1 hypothetical protein M4486_04145 [Brachybacterium kimchii]